MTSLNDEWKAACDSIIETKPTMKAHDWLMPFLENIKNEAKKGYMVDMYSEDETFIDGYVTAVYDIMERIALEEGMND